MNFKKTIFYALVICTLFVSPAYCKKRISASDFVSPVQAESEEQEAELLKVDNEDKVTVSEDEKIGGTAVVKANSAKDAINYTLKNKLKMLPGANPVKFPSGLGWVSTGVAFYIPMPNPTATLLEQRKAYVVAYTKAKVALSEALYGLESKGKDSIKELTTNLSTSGDADLTNMSTTLSMSNEEIVEAMLRGYVVYSVSEESVKNQKKVTVSIVTTTKTINGIKRASADSISAESIAEGLDQILVEIENNIIPPVGGKSIVVPQTSEIAFVGFGTSVVRQSDNPAVQMQNYLNAQKVAKMKARNELVGILQGDQVKSRSSNSENQETEYKQYEELVKDDPLNKNNEKEVNVFNEAQNKFKNTQTFSNAISSIRSGRVPEGVEVRCFDNDDQTVVTGIAVYTPSLTSSTKNLKQAMEEAYNEDFSPEKAKKNFQSVPIKSRDTGTRKLNDSYITGGEAPKSVSGQVTNDSDL